MSAWSHALLSLLICVGLLVVMPLGLRLVAAPGVPAVRRLWFLAATPAAASVWLPRGWLTAVFAAAYLPAVAALLASAGRVVLSGRPPGPDRDGAPAPIAADRDRSRTTGAATPPTAAGTDQPGTAINATAAAYSDGLSSVTVGHSAQPHTGADQCSLTTVDRATGDERRGPGADAATPWVTARAVAVATALASPAVAGCALVAERAGQRLFGFELDVLALTVAHFQYAGFAAALIAGLVCEVDGDRPAGRLAAWSVPAGVAVVFAGFFTSEWVELAGAAVLTVGMWLVGWLTWRRARPGTAARGLLLVSAGTLAATMVLALDWALGQAVGLPHLPISWMVATHGLANALGFALCALLAWHRIRARQATGPPEPARPQQANEPPQQARPQQANGIPQPTGPLRTSETPPRQQPGPPPPQGASW
jgi:hypothetical protein